LILAALERTQSAWAVPLGCRWNEPVGQLVLALLACGVIAYAIECLIWRPAPAQTGFISATQPQCRTCVMPSIARYALC
jgi:hypothetical protein